MGVDQETLDLFLRQKYWTLTTQTALVLALEKLAGVAGRVEVLETAVTADNEDQTRFLAVGLALLAREHGSTPLTAILDGKPIGLTKEDRVVATLPLDYVCWTERVAKFAAREDLVSHRPTILITGRLSPRARSEMESAGWEIREGVPLAGAFYQ
jgi:antitoxin (DNA-binding transcriptional repressor) of toxin-antitoxin stability system